MCFPFFVVLMLLVDYVGADILAGLIAIGYNITVVDSIEGFWKIKSEIFDIIITDYDG